MQLQRSWLSRFAASSGRLILALLVFSVVAAAAAAPPVAAQDPGTLVASDTLQEIRLHDGSTLFGRIVAVDADRVTIETTGGVRLDVQRAQIRSVQVVRGQIRHGEVWPEDPNSTRLFFGPTGRMLRTGEGYAGVFELFFPFVSFGITDFITIAGGTPVIPEAIGQVFYLAPKVGARLAPRVHVAAGVLALFNLGDWAPASVGILYGTGTFGSADNAVTLGAGWPFVGGDLERRPVFMLGGEARAQRRVKLITENYLVTYRDEVYYPDEPFFPGSVPRSRTRTAALLSGGIRIFGDRLSADAGLGVFAAEGEVTCCLPLVNFVYNFGGAR
jgi:hypothetical protein